MSSEPRPDQPLPAHFFERVDPAPDDEFYRVPRFVTHIDDETIEALKQLYRETIRPGSDILDLMSSWVSHLPEDVRFGRVAGLGMNAEELRGNPQLTEWAVQDLNRDPELPYEDESFDTVLIAVSVQYLTRPVEVFASVRRVLRPGGGCLVSCSHRMFPTKAVAVWRSLGPEDRVRLVASYFGLAGGFDEPVLIDRSPPNADPLWVVAARRT